jgi:hypothetical protein
MGSGGMSAETWGVPGRDLDRDRDFEELARGLEIEMPKMLIFRRAVACVGVVGLDLRTSFSGVSGGRRGEGTGMEEGGCRLALGVPGVIVEFVAVVVEDMGREGILCGGFEPEGSLGLPFCGSLVDGTGFSDGKSVFD